MPSVTLYPETPGWYLVEDLITNEVYPARLRRRGGELDFIGYDGRTYQPGAA